MTDFTNTDDTIDVRDVIARFEELEGRELDSKESDEEFNIIESLLVQLEQSGGGDEKWRGDWYPVTMIRASYFEDAMDELLEDCGMLPKDLPCYLKITVDYNALKMDYTSVEFDGVTYWVR